MSRAPRNNRRRYQTVEAVRGDDTGNNGCKGSGGTRNLHAATAKQRDKETGNDSRIKALLGGNTGGDSKRDGKRQRHNGNDDTRDDVLGNLPAQLLFIGMLDNAEQYGLNLVALHGLQFVSIRLVDEPLVAHRSPNKNDKAPARGRPRRKHI